MRSGVWMLTGACVQVLAGVCMVGLDPLHECVDRDDMDVVLGQISDGQAAWDTFYSGVTAVFEGNASSATTLGVIAGVIIVVALVMWLNLRLARWLSRKLEALRDRR